MKVRIRTPRRLESIVFWCLIAAAVCMIVMNAGCATRSIDYTQTTTTAPDGTVTVTKHVAYSNEGNDTGFGLLTIGRDDEGNPTLTIESYKSEDMIARAAMEGMKTARELAGAASGAPN